MDGLASGVGAEAAVGTSHNPLATDDVGIATDALCNQPWMLAHATAESRRLPYRNFAKPGVRLLQQTITGIDPAAKRITTNAGTFEADYLIVALGADYDFAATPGLSEVNEFYSVAGAEKLRAILPNFRQGHALIGVCGAPFKCPPAPSECALILHDYLSERGVRQNCKISFLLPLSSPVPPSPETSKALIAAFAERGIDFHSGKRVVSIDAGRRVAMIDDGSETAFDLFLGVPKHRVPQVVLDSGMAEDGWVPVNPRTLETKFPGVYAVGDGANTGTPKAGVFAEGAAAAVAGALVAKIRNKGDAALYSGAGACYIEFGGGQIGKVEVDFFSGPKPTGTYWAPSTSLRSEKDAFGSSRRARWFGAAATVSRATAQSAGAPGPSPHTGAVIARPRRKRWPIVIGVVALLSCAALAAGVASGNLDMAALMKRLSDLLPR
jgi:sulfide:quinone oxidoreductase